MMYNECSMEEIFLALQRAPKTAKQGLKRIHNIYRFAVLQRLSLVDKGQVASKP